MPYLKIQTNLPLTKKAERTILKDASALGVMREDIEQALKVEMKARSQ